MILDQSRCTDFKRIRNVRPIDCGPADVLCRNGVCITRVPATHATKLGLTESIAFVNPTTLRTSPRSVARINKNNWHPDQRRFVANKTLELAKCPTMQMTPLPLLSPYPCADPLQIFQGYPALGALSNGNKFFGNSVVNIPAEPSFFGSPFAQQPLCRSRTFSLQLLSQLSMPDAQSIQLSTGEPNRIAGLRDPHKTQINPDPVLNIKAWSCSDFNRSRQKPTPIAIDQIALSTLRLQKVQLGFKSDVAESFTSFDCPDTDISGSEIPGKDAQIIGDRAMSTEHTLAFVAQFVGISYFRDDSDNGLCRDRRKLTAELNVEKPLERELVKFASVPGKLTQPISSGIKRFKRLQQNVRVYGRRLQLDLGDQFHSYIFLRIAPLELKL
jgi:hypothetical protein